MSLYYYTLKSILTYFLLDENRTDWNVFRVIEKGKSSSLICWCQPVGTRHNRVIAIAYFSRFSALPVHARGVRMLVMARDGRGPQAHFFPMVVVANPSVLAGEHVFVALARKVRRWFRMLGDVPRSLRTFRHPLLVSLPPDLSVFGRLFSFLKHSVNTIRVLQYNLRHRHVKYFDRGPAHLLWSLPPRPPPLLRLFSATRRTTSLRWPISNWRDRTSRGIWWRWRRTCATVQRLLAPIRIQRPGYNSD